MTDKKNVPDTVTRRLPRYYRQLGELLSCGRLRISSKELSEKIGVTASQIRQDLNHFGCFGQQGYGYNVEFLYNEIRKILGITKNYNLIIIGAGNIGQALANYSSFEKSGFYIRALFDINPILIGTRVRGIEVLHTERIPDYLNNNSVDMAVLCVPGHVARKASDLLTKNGVKYIWNFSLADLNVPKNVIVENVNLTDSLISLVYRLNEDDDPPDAKE